MVLHICNIKQRQEDTFDVICHVSIHGLQVPSHRRVSGNKSQTDTVQGGMPRGTIPTAGVVGKWACWRASFPVGTVMKSTEILLPRRQLFFFVRRKAAVKNFEAAKNGALVGPTRGDGDWDYCD